MAKHKLDQVKIVDQTAAKEAAKALKNKKATTDSLHERVTLIEKILGVSGDNGASGSKL